MLAPNSSLGEYTVLQFIGRGGFAEVYLIYSPRYCMNFAGKVIKEMTMHVVEELDILLQLDHPFLVHLYNYFSDSNHLVMVLDYCPYGSLSEHIKRHGPLSSQQFIYTAREIAQAVQYLQEHNLAHRDIKPQNILITQQGHIKLTDFGLSIKHDGEKCTAYNGTPAFQAPELHERFPHDPFAADMWSVGVSFYFLLTGHLPWLSTSEKEMKAQITMLPTLQLDEIPSTFRPIIRSLIRFDPKKRASASELLDFLDLLLDPTIRYERSELLPRLQKEQIRGSSSCPDSSGIRLTSFKPLAQVARKYKLNRCLTRVRTFSDVQSIL